MQECKKKSLKVCSCDLYNFLLTNYYRIYDDYHLKLEGEAIVKERRNHMEEIYQNE